MTARIPVVARAALGLFWWSACIYKGVVPCPFMDRLAAISGAASAQCMAGVVLVLEAAAGWLVLVGMTRTGVTLGSALLLGFVTVRMVEPVGAASGACGCLPFAGDDPRFMTYAIGFAILLNLLALRPCSAARASARDA